MADDPQRISSVCASVVLAVAAVLLHPPSAATEARIKSDLTHLTKHMKAGTFVGACEVDSFAAEFPDAARAWSLLCELGQPQSGDAKEGTKRAAPTRPELVEEQPPTMPAVSSGDAGGKEPPAKKVKTEGSGEERAVKPDEDFKVTANADDDEATLDEEEFEQGGAANQAAETSALADEAEMPLEQLLAMYGLSKDQLEGNAPGLRDEDEDKEGEEEEEEPVDVDEETATLTAKGWYDTLGPFASMYEMVVRNPARASSRAFTVRSCPAKH